MDLPEFLLPFSVLLLFFFYFIHESLLRGVIFTCFVELDLHIIIFSKPKAIFNSFEISEFVFLMFPIIT